MTDLFYIESEAVISMIPDTDIGEDACRALEGINNITLETLIRELRESGYVVTKLLSTNLTETEALVKEHGL